MSLKEKNLILDKELMDVKHNSIEYIENQIKKLQAQIDKNTNGMDIVPIYRFQLEDIKEALRLTANIHNSRKPTTAHDRMVKQSEQYAVNALDGNIDKVVPYTD